MILHQQKMNQFLESQQKQLNLQQQHMQMLTQATMIAV
jgi:hypothetical protein